MLWPIVQHIMITNVLQYGLDVIYSSIKQYPAEYLDPSCTGFETKFLIMTRQNIVML